MHLHSVCPQFIYLTLVILHFNISNRRLDVPSFKSLPTKKCILCSPFISCSYIRVLVGSVLSFNLMLPFFDHWVIIRRQLFKHSRKLMWFYPLTFRSHSILLGLRMNFLSFDLGCSCLDSRCIIKKQCVLHNHDLHMISPLTTKKELYFV